MPAHRPPTQPDPRIRAAVDQLVAVPLELIEDRVFRGVRVSLDGRRFVDCTFVDCELFGFSGHWKLEGFDFQGTTHWVGDLPGGNVVILTAAVAALKRLKARASGPN